MKNVIFISLLFVATITNGQALLLEKGQSGTNIGIGVNGISNATSVYFDVGYSPNGKLNIGIGLGKSSFDKINNYGEFFIIPYIEYYFIKQDKNIPLSVSIDASYQRTTDTGGLLEDQNLELKGNHFRGGINLAHNIDVSKTFRLLPFGSISYASGKSIISDGIDEISQTNDYVSGRIGIIGAIKVNSHYFNIAPALFLNKDDTGFGVFVSYNIQ
jgi:hypothetical protein